MRVSTDWLEEFVTRLPAAGELAEQLTMRGFEVDSVERAGPELQKVIVGKVAGCSAIPGTSLRKCSVKAGGDRGTLSIICGAPNVAAGKIVAVALPGARLRGQEIREREIRGVHSEGMICSEYELGLGGDQDEIMLLDARTRIGQSLEKALKLDAEVLDVAVTPNRGDCLSVLGIAREICAFGGGRLRKDRLKPENGRRIDESYGVQIEAEAAEACPIYRCAVVRSVHGPASPSPLRIRERLRRCGVRPIGLVVDITNYVMLAYGQPLHAFDLNRLEGEIRVRFARKGERLLLLDGQDVSLEPSTLVIADEKRPVALGGVMGGMESGVSGDTTDILLEGAFFSPQVVRGRTRMYNLSSEAAFRFERGVDFRLSKNALRKAVQLLAKEAGDCLSGPVTQAKGGEPPRRDPILVPDGMFRRFLGIDTTPGSAVRTLKRFGFKAAATKSKVTATPPSYRFDVSIPEDLAEEIARDHGYSRIEATSPYSQGGMLPPESEAGLGLRIKRALAAMGYSEVVTYAFVPEKWESAYHANPKPIRLSNPITDEATVMRSSLIGGLLDRAEHNHRHKQERLQIFEAGRCFPSEEAIEGRQPVRIAGLCYGSIVPLSWDGKAREFDYFDVRANVESLLPLGRVSFECWEEHPAFHPKQCTRVKVDGKQTGIAGALHPRLAQEFEIPPSTYLFELDMDFVVESVRGCVAVATISKLPLVRRDLSVAVPASHSAGDVLIEGRKLEEKEEVRKVELFDKYQPVDGSVRLGLRITMQGIGSNLEEREIGAIVNELESRLAKRFGARKLAAGD